MTKELTQFKYEQLDESTADFLRQKELNMRQIVGKAYTELGRELYEAQQRLASHNKYEGVFVKWCGYLGFTMKQVYRLIDRYNLLTNCQNSEQKEFLEDLPVSLAYEISGKSSESTPEKAQAKAEVLAGDIATLKEYRERIKVLERKAEQAEKQAEAERKERERLEREHTELTNDEIEMLRKENESLRKINEINERRAEEGDRIKSELERLGTAKDDYGRAINAATELSGLVVKIEHLLKDELAPIKYSRAITEQKDNEIVQRNLEEIIRIVRDWCNEMDSYLSKNNYIDVEVIDYE